MDIGPEPKLALFLSLALMNLVAVGICIYGPSPKDGRSSQDSRKGSLFIIKKRIESLLNDQVGVDTETNDAATDKIAVEEDNVLCKSEVLDETHSLSVEASETERGDDATSPPEEYETNGTNLNKLTPQPPTIEDSDQKIHNDLTGQPGDLEKDEKHLNVITINENFDNNGSSDEGSNISLNDMCGRDAEMRYLPHDLSKSVTAVIAKSFQLIDTFNTKVVPAVENFNEQISKTARLERSMDSSVVGAINTAICPAVIRMSDSINRMHEKFNRVTENINRTNEPKERSVSCQVSETLLGKSIGLKKSFFSPMSPTSEARIMNLFGHISLRTVSRRKDRPGFKTLATQYWANRRRALARKFRKTRSTDNLKYEKDTKERITDEESSAVGSFGSVNGQLKHFQEMNSEEIVKEEVITEEPNLFGDKCNVVEEFLIVKENNSREPNVAEEEINRMIEYKQGSTTEESDAVASSSNYCGFPSLPSQLPSYLSSSYDDFDVKSSVSKVDESLEQNSGNHVNQGNRKSENDEEVFPVSLFVNAITGSKNTSIILVPEMRDETEAGHKLVEPGTMSDNRSIKSLQLSATVQNTVERFSGPLKNCGGFHDVLDMLDPDVERNTVENLFLLILKLFEAWSESQLTIVPSRALSQVSPSESSCLNSSSMRSKSVDPSEVNIGCLNKSPSPNYYSCSETHDLDEVNNINEVPDICMVDEKKGSDIVKEMVEEALSRTPECTEMDVSRPCQFSETSSSVTVMNNLELNLKALLYKEQYSIARKIASECIEIALSSSETVRNVRFTEIQRVESKTPINVTGKMNAKFETTEDSASASHTSSVESFHSWAPGSSSDDYSYYECNTPSDLMDASEKSSKKGKFDGSGWIIEKEKSLPSFQEAKESRSTAHCSTASYVSRPESAVVLKASSIESWMLTSTSGDGMEIRNSHSEFKSEEMSDLSSRPISFTTTDYTSDRESSHSLAETTASESSKLNIRRRWSSRLFNKMKKKRPKTPKNTIAGPEEPSHAQSDSAMKVTESSIYQNTSLSDEN